MTLVYMRMCLYVAGKRLYGNLRQRFNFLDHLREFVAKLRLSKSLENLHDSITVHVCVHLCMYARILSTRVSPNRESISRLNLCSI
jgi:hypothetical protein